jgi:hypothetical protein
MGKVPTKISTCSPVNSTYSCMLSVAGQNGVLPPALHIVGHLALPCRGFFANGKSDRRVCGQADECRVETGPEWLARLRHDLSAFPSDLLPSRKRPTSVAEQVKALPKNCSLGFRMRFHGREACRTARRSSRRISRLRHGFHGGLRLRHVEIQEMLFDLSC